jgi:RNA polymerase sigma-70 factor (ECF subfamily)
MAVQPDVEQLARDAATGDPLAMQRLLRRIEPDVLRRCARYLPCRQDAEEATQDALVAVATHLPDFEWRSTFSTWLHTVVSTSALSTYRSLKRRADRQVNADELLERRPDPRTTSVIAGSRIDLLDALEKIGQHRPQLVRPLVLRDLSGLGYAEIAEVLDLPVGTVKSQVHDGRKAVAALLRPGTD